MLPFGQYFYYKRDTPAFERWRAGRRARNNVAARDTGGYNAYDANAWNDEVLVGDTTADSKNIVRGLIKEEGRGAEFADVTMREGEGGVDMAGLRRTTEADEEANTKSLERALSRTLYLLVKRKASFGKVDGYWAFPSGVLEGKEGLREVSFFAKTDQIVKNGVRAIDLNLIRCLLGRLPNASYTALAGRTC